MKNVSFYQAQNLSLSSSFQRKEKFKAIAGDVFLWCGAALSTVAVIAMAVSNQPVWNIGLFAVGALSLTVAGFIKEAEGKWN